MSIPQSFIQELLSRIDVVDVVGRYVELKKGGANFMGLCPFHGEKSPSFSVSPTKQFYHCFGCGKNGNAIGFLMEHAGMGFVEAINDLAQQVGLQVPDDDISPQNKERAAAARQKQNTLSDVLEKAALAYNQHLRANPFAVQYLKDRGVSGHIAKRFGLGYAPAGWRTLASTFANYDDPLLEESGLVVMQAEDGRRYDRFRERVMFPIRNVKGECIGFGGRIIPPSSEKSPSDTAQDHASAAGPKYLNSPETPVFHKGRELYGLYEARTAIREHAYALVTEGYMDVVALAQLGFENTVATLGTACTPEHVQKLLRFTSAIVFSFDGDNAGRRAARKALESTLPHANDTRSIKFLFLPQEHDPDSYIRQHGSDAFARMVNNAMPLSRFLMETSAQGCDLGTAEGRAHMASQARPLWNGMPDGVLKRQLLSEIANASQLSTADLSELWIQANQREAARKPANQHPLTAPTSPPTLGASSSGIAPSMNTSAEHTNTATATTASLYSPPPWSQAPDDIGWAPTPSNAYHAQEHNSYPSSNKHDKASHTRPWKKKKFPWSQPPSQPPLPNTPSSSRADHAARLLLSHMGFLAELTDDDHALLGAQPAPYGPLFVWLENQMHDSGSLPWAVLHERLKGTPSEDLAYRVMTGSHAQTEGDFAEWRAELTDLLTRMHIEDIEGQRNAAVAAGDIEQYKALDTRWRALKAAIASPAPPNLK